MGPLYFADANAPACHFRDRRIMENGLESRVPRVGMRCPGVIPRLSGGDGDEVSAFVVHGARGRALLSGHVSEMEEHIRFMRYALRLANNALHTGEVPVACVFVYRGEVVSYGSNNTNDSLSGITHAEFRGINTILDKVKACPGWENVFEKPEDIFKEVDLYVTVEPCVMCASALKQIGIRNVYFGCGNERFGGNGSVLKVNTDKTTPENNYRSCPGVLRREAVLLLRDFYTHENKKAPEPRNKKNRNLNLETFPDLIWKDYLSKEEFVEIFGPDKLACYDANADVFEDVDWSIMSAANIDISDIDSMVQTPLHLDTSTKKRRLT